jgi:hypothetical protein
MKIKKTDFCIYFSDSHADVQYMVMDEIVSRTPTNYGKTTTERGL